MDQQDSQAHKWNWNDGDKSHECILSDDKLEVCFHPQCSESAAAIRGTEPLIRNGNQYYWEISVFEKIYGTSVMFGICTKDQRLHSKEYCNLIGLDRHGWSLSHKGLIWHDGKNVPFMPTLQPDQSVTIGLLFDTMRGELSYFLNGKSLGVAFHGLNYVDSDLYPVIGSTAKRTRIRLVEARRSFISLMDRSCFILLNSIESKEELIRNLHQYRVPKYLIDYWAKKAQVVCGNQTKTIAKCDQYNWTLDQVTHHNKRKVANLIDVNKKY